MNQRRTDQHIGGNDVRMAGGIVGPVGDEDRPITRWDQDDLVERYGTRDRHASCCYNWARTSHNWELIETLIEGNFRRWLQWP